MTLRLYQESCSNQQSCSASRGAVTSRVAVTCRSVPVVARVEKPPTSLRGRKAALTPAWSPLRQAAARVAQAASDTARHNCCACAPAWGLSGYSMGLLGYSRKFARSQLGVSQLQHEVDQGTA